MFARYFRFLMFARYFRFLMFARYFRFLMFARYFPVFFDFIIIRRIFREKDYSKAVFDSYIKYPIFWVMACSVHCFAMRPWQGRLAFLPIRSVHCFAMRPWQGRLAFLPLHIVYKQYWFFGVYQSGYENLFKPTTKQVWVHIAFERKPCKEVPCNEVVVLINCTHLCSLPLANRAKLAFAERKCRACPAITCSRVLTIDAFAASCITVGARIIFFKVWFVSVEDFCIFRQIV